MIKQIVFVFGVILQLLVSISSDAQILPKEDTTSDSKPTKKPAVQKNTSKETITGPALIVKIIPDVDCIIKVDGERKGTATAGNVLKVKLGVGQFVITATGTTKKDEKFEQDYTVTKDQLGSELILRISIKNNSSDVSNNTPQKNTVPDPLKRTELNMVTITGGGFDFRINKYLVTQREWQAAMGNNPSFFHGCDDCPVEQVSWSDAQEFISKLNALTGKRYRLPTEAEWDYAAKGGSHSHGYDYGGGNDIDEVGWYSGNSENKTHPVGQKKANELGLFDITGNVWEWCQDWSDNNLQYRVLRGGSWGGGAIACRVSSRGLDHPDLRDSDNGLRLAQDR